MWVGLPGTMVLRVADEGFPRGALLPEQNASRGPTRQYVYMSWKELLHNELQDSAPAVFFTAGHRAW